jgi:hypothetical protein
MVLKTPTTTIAMAIKATSTKSNGMLCATPNAVPYPVLFHTLPVVEFPAKTVLVMGRSTLNMIIKATSAEIKTAGNETSCPLCLVMRSFTRNLHSAERADNHDRDRNEQSQDQDERYLLCDLKRARVSREVRASADDSRVDDRQDHAEQDNHCDHGSDKDSGELQENSSKFHTYLLH